MNDSFARLVSPVFQRVIDLLHQIEQGESPAWEPEREQLWAILDEAEQQAGASSQLAHDFALAKHALVYWIDEVLINSSWSHAWEWRQHILEWDIYQERLRADRFYEKAHEAEALATTDPLETFFLCLALGFRGRYVDNPAELRKWADRVYNRIAASSQQADKFLPDDSSDHERLKPLPGQSILLAVSILVSFTALATLACFVLAVPPWE
jgi:type VI secretion system protein ImpK